MDLSMMNDAQKRAVIHTEGPLLILAGAGSGKTRVLTHRIAYLVEEKGIHPANILAITFTNKAAKEMVDRVENLINKPMNLWVTTFHSACVRILRREIDKIGYDKNFVIYDGVDQKTLLKQCYKELNINDKLYPLAMVQSRISSAKDKLYTPNKFKKEYEGDFQMETIGNIYKLYQNKLRGNNALDFDDLIFKTIELFEENEDILGLYQDKFRYIMVDEYQDTSQAQYRLVSLLAEGHQNLCVVGDIDQCIPEDMKVITLDGKKEISTLKMGESILAPAGHGKVMKATVDNIVKRPYKGPIVKVTTKGGNVIKATPNHITCGKLNMKQGVYYVYLMYKEGIGYRIGQTQGVRSRKVGEIANGLMVRLNQEKADKAWILKVCETKEDACYYEQLLSTKYSIPTMVFHNSGRNMSISQETIDKLFNNIDTKKNVIKLMEELLLFEEYPHHKPSGVTRGNVSRRILNMTFFGGKESSKGWHSHRIQFNTSSKEVREKLKRNDFPIRNSKGDTWRVETERLDYDETNVYGKDIVKVVEDVAITKRARLVKEESYLYMPIAHLRPSMSVAVYKENKMIEDIVENVEFEEFNGHVYDISVPNARHFICENMAVHNSIYGWRGADIRNILSFEEDFKNAVTIKLEHNYRSTKVILDAANSVIKNNINRKSKTLLANKGQGEKIKYYRADDEKYEAQYIVKNIIDMVKTDGRNYREFAVLYRTNAQSRSIEDMFVRGRIPYRIYGGLKFYDRKEIKDIVAYLRLIQNPVDDIALKRVINVPKRGIGNRSVEKFEELANDTGESIYSVVLDDEMLSGFSKRVMSGLSDFTDVIEKCRSLKDTAKVSEIIQIVIEESGYIAELENEDTIEAQSRIENIRELLSVAKEFEKDSDTGLLMEFLEKTSLSTDLDSMDEDDNKVVLMTLHSAKGLEFPVVFLAGLEEKIFPISRALESEKDIEEERRLCYVGITRAEEMLFISHARMRMLYGKTNYNPISRFVDEIASALIERDKAAIEAKDKAALAPASGIYRGTTINQAPKATKKASSENIHPGARVLHDKFGQGTIISIKDKAGDKEITIAFQNAGIKKLMLSFAPIKVV